MLTNFVILIVLVTLKTTIARRLSFNSKSECQRFWNSTSEQNKCRSNMWCDLYENEAYPTLAERKTTECLTTGGCNATYAVKCDAFFCVLIAVNFILPSVSTCFHMLMC